VLQPAYERGEFLTFSWIRKLIWRVERVDNWIQATQRNNGTDQLRLGLLVPHLNKTKVMSAYWQPSEYFCFLVDRNFFGK